MVAWSTVILVYVEVTKMFHILYFQIMGNVRLTCTYSFLQAVFYSCACTVYPSLLNLFVIKCHFFPNRISLQLAARGAKLL